MSKTSDTANDAAVNAYGEWFEQLRAEHGEQLKVMPLPEGLPEYLHQLVTSGDEDAIQFMLKLAWQLGAQVGYAAGTRQEAEVATVKPNSRVQA